MVDPIALKALKQGVMAGAKSELAAIAPDLLTDPDVEIYYDPAKTEIAQQEFDNDESMEVAYFPKVETIGVRAFNKQSWTVQHTLKAAIFPNAKTIGRQAFRWNTSLEYIYAPRVETLESVFERCALKIVDMPNLQVIESGMGACFMNCSSLTDVNMPALIEINDSMTFDSCTALVNVNMPNLTTLHPSSGIRVFSNCTSLKRIDLPKLTSVSNNMFAKCSALETVILRNAELVTLANTGAFTQTPIASGTGYIYVPSALIEEYKAATNWSTYAAQFRAIEDYPEICDPDLDEPITKGEAMQMVKEAGGVCVINYTCDIDDALTTITNPTKDKTYAEAKAVYDAGGLVVCRLKYLSGPMANCVIQFPAMVYSEAEGTTGFVFSAADVGGANLITLMSDDSFEIAID